MQMATVRHFLLCILGNCLIPKISAAHEDLAAFREVFSRPTSIQVKNYLKIYRRTCTLMIGVEIDPENLRYSRRDLLVIIDGRVLDFALCRNILA